MRMFSNKRFGGGHRWIQQEASVEWLQICGGLETEFRTVIAGVGKDGDEPGGVVAQFFYNPRRPSR